MQISYLNSNLCQFLEGFVIGFGKFGLGKKYRFRCQRIWSWKKVSVLENLVLKKVSVSVSENLVSGKKVPVKILVSSFSRDRRTNRASLLNTHEQEGWYHQTKWWPYYDEQEIYAQEEKGKFHIFSIIYKCLMKRSRNTHWALQHHYSGESRRKPWRGGRGDPIFWPNRTKSWQIKRDQILPNHNRSRWPYQAKPE